MTGPKHLWSGDWERASAAASRREPDHGADATEPPPPPKKRTLSRRRRKLAAALVVIALGIAGIAYAVTATGGSHSRATAALGGTDTAPFTLTAPPRTFSVPTTPTTPGSPTTPTTPGSPTTPTTPGSPTTPTTPGSPTTPTTPGSPTTPTTPGSPTTPTTPTHPATPTNPTKPAIAPDPIRWLGMEVITTDSGQAVVDTVAINSAGDRAGVDPGDQIQSIAGRAVSGSQSIAGALHGLHAGQHVPIQVARGGGVTVGLEITLGAAPTAYP